MYSTFLSLTIYEHIGVCYVSLVWFNGQCFNMLHKLADIKIMVRRAVYITSEYKVNKIINITALILLFLSSQHSSIC
jgi:hypothetical protein